MTRFPVEKGTRKICEVVMNGNAQREAAREIFLSALRAVDPHDIVRFRLHEIRSLYETAGFRRLVVVGFGKASFPMAKAIDDGLPDLVDEGIIITKEGHIPPGEGLHKIEAFEGGHPVPDEAGMRATEKIIELISREREETLVVALVSGGGSALLVAPCEGISLAEKQEVTRLMLAAGADIEELNTVRKHLSRVKGGRFAELAAPATVLSFILSDVIGDRLDVIASGPAVPDPTTYSDAAGILAKYDLIKRVPRAVTELMVKGVDGRVPDTPKAGDKVFEKAFNKIIGSNSLAIAAAEVTAGNMGYGVEVLSSVLQGEARDVGVLLAEKALLGLRSIGAGRSKLCVISGGETTVTVRGTGKGGRNTELALAFAMKIAGQRGITLLSAGTDGTDGPTDAAGAIVDGATVEAARGKGLDPRAFLDNNDSYTFFQQTDELLVTGPTGTNVMDIQVILVER